MNVERRSDDWDERDACVWDVSKVGSCCRSLLSMTWRVLKSSSSSDEGAVMFYVQVNRYSCMLMREMGTETYDLPINLPVSIIRAEGVFPTSFSLFLGHTVVGCEVRNVLQGSR